MSDLVNLGFRADTGGLTRAQRELNKTAIAGGRADKATSSLGSTFMKVASTIGIATAAMAGLKKTLDVTRQFDVLNAQLITATGSAKNAAIAFDAIAKFAANTPYDLGQATESFTKLVNLGLTPSEKALTSYGNTASAMGKSLNQFIEAVADATTNEFERLKEFGIKSKQEGDNVEFTFRGITTTVKKEAGAIEGYLQALGENEFAGAMANRMDTLDGKISNLGDSWDMLFLDISKNGAGELMADSVDLANDAISGLSDFLNSGQLDQSFSVLATKFSGFTNDITGAVDYITSLFNMGSQLWGEDVDKFISFIGDALKNMPENFRAAIQLSAVEIASLVDYAAAYGEAFAEVLGVKLAQAVEYSKVYGKAIGEALNPFSDGETDIDSELERLSSLAIDMTDSIFKNAEAKAEATAEIRRSSITGIIEERDRAVEASDVQIGKISALGEAYKAQQLERSKASSDVLSQFKIQSEETSKAVDDVSELGDNLQSITDDIDNFGGAWSATGNIVVDAFGDMTDAMNDYANRMESIGKIQTKIDAAIIDAGDDKEKLSKLAVEQTKLDKEKVSAELDGYKSLASGAAGMFSEKTAAAKAFNAVEQSIAAAQLAMSLQNMLSSTAETATVVANETTKQAALGTTAVLNQGSGDPYTAFARMAAMAALVASLVSNFSGGGSSYEALAPGGTGSVLGDSDAQSESILNAYDSLEDIEIDQLAELQSIRKSMSSLSSGIEQLAKSFVSDLDFTDSNIALSNTQNGSGIIDLANKLGLSDILGSFGDNIVGEVLGGFFGSSKQKLVDSGIRFVSQTYAEIFESGQVDASVFQTVETTKKKFWGLSKSTSTNTNLTGIDADIANQIASVFGYIGDTIIEASDSLFGDNFTEQLLQSYQIDIGDISFKDKTGEEIQKELEAIFSQQADLMTSYAFPQLQEYQDMGEGLFETLIRVNQEQAIFNDAMERTGYEYSKFVTELEKVDFAQSIIDLTGGIEQFSELSNSFFESFYSDAEQLAYLEQSLGEAFSGLGLSMVGSRDEFKDLINGIDITTESGQQLYAMLLQLVPGMDEYLSALEDEQAAKDAAAEKLAEQSQSLDIQLLEAQGKSSEALALSRQMELDAADESLHAIMRRIWGLEDEAAAEAAALAISNEAASLNIRLLEAQGMSEQVLALQREAELAALDESNRALLLRIYAIEDEAAAQIKADEAAAEAMAVAEARSNLHIDLLNAQGRSEEALMLTRKQQLEDLDPSLRALQLQVWAEQELTAAREASEATLSQSIADMESQQSTLESAADGFRNISDAISDLIFDTYATLDSDSVSLSSAVDAARNGDFSVYGRVNSTSEIGDAGDYQSINDYIFARDVAFNKLAEIRDLSLSAENVTENAIDAIDTNISQMTTDIFAQGESLDSINSSNATIDNGVLELVNTMKSEKESAEMAAMELKALLEKLNKESVSANKTLKRIEQNTYEVIE